MSLKSEESESKSHEQKQMYRDLKRKLKLLIYENEYYQEELRKYQKELLIINRDKNFLMDKLLQYENISTSSSDSDDTDSSESGIELRLERSSSSTNRRRRLTSSNSETAATKPKVKRKRINSNGAAPASTQSSLNTYAAPNRNKNLNAGKKGFKSLSALSTSTFTISSSPSSSTASTTKVIPKSLPIPSLTSGTSTPAFVSTFSSIAPLLSTSDGFHSNSLKNNVNLPISYLTSAPTSSLNSSSSSSLSSSSIASSLISTPSSYPSNASSASDLTFSSTSISKSITPPPQTHLSLSLASSMVPQSTLSTIASGASTISSYSSTFTANSLTDPIFNCSSLSQQIKSEFPIRTIKSEPLFILSLGRVNGGHLTSEEIERHFESRPLQPSLLLPEKTPLTVPVELFSNESSLDLPESNIKSE